MRAYELHILTRRCALTASERLLLREIAMYASGDEGECRASQETLAEDTGLGERTVRRLMTRLVKLGVLVRASRKGALRIVVAAIPAGEPTPDPATDAGSDPAGDESGSIPATMAGTEGRDVPIPATMAATDPATMAGTAENSGHHGRSDSVTLDGVPATMATIPATMAGHSGHHGRRSVVVSDPYSATDSGRRSDGPADEGGRSNVPSAHESEPPYKVERPTRGGEPDEQLIAELLALQTENGSELIRHTAADRSALLGALRAGRSPEFLRELIATAEERGIRRCRWATLLGDAFAGLRAEVEAELLARRSQQSRSSIPPVPPFRIKPAPKRSSA